jgi:hypothetical protein
MPEPTDQTLLSFATRFAKIHRAGSLIFWTADDWGQMYGVHCRRIDPENVSIAVRTVGRGCLDPQTTKN